MAASSGLSSLAWLRSRSERPRDSPGPPRWRATVRGAWSLGVGVLGRARGTPASSEFLHCKGGLSRERPGMPRAKLPLGSRELGSCEAKTGDPNGLRLRLTSAPFLGTCVLVCRSVCRACCLGFSALCVGSLALSWERYSHTGALTCTHACHTCKSAPWVRRRRCARSSMAAGAQTPLELLALILPQDASPPERHQIFRLPPPASPNTHVYTASEISFLELL